MVGCNHHRLSATWRLLEQWNSNGFCRAITAETGNAVGQRYSFAMGQLSADDQTAVVEDSIFLIASPTKPIVAMAAMMLAEQGMLQLDHHVRRYLPDFTGGGKDQVRILHLLTHTSGLPDMLPNNDALRQAHSPLAEFMKHVYEVDLLAPPGTRVHYQSMGILTLATIVEKITRQALPEFLSDNIFAPLNMNDTTLGAPDSWKSGGPSQRMAWSQVDEQPGAAQWGWNSWYWRQLGAPWGGLLSTAPDIGCLCRHLLNILGGQHGILSRQALRVMTTNQLPYLRKIPEPIAGTLPWGLGWQLNWPSHPHGFGSLLPPECFGHWGATGTLVWIDPTRGVYGVVLTTEPVDIENRRQIAFGNMSSLIWDD